VKFPLVQPTILLLSALAAAPATAGGTKCPANTVPIGGDVWELVADLVPTAATCADPIFPGTEDRNCTREVTATEPTPGAVLRGGAYNLEQDAGVFAMAWQGASATSQNNIGFRCAR
jgi:formylglycine-generating enzyme required for sulfatase activity